MTEENEGLFARLNRLIWLAQSDEYIDTDEAIELDSQLAAALGVEP